METANRTVLRCERCGQPQASGATDVGCLNCLLLDALVASGSGEAGDANVSPGVAGGTGLLPRVPGSRCYQHYEILTHEDGSLWELGRGAMGVTYKALDVNLRVPVALKIINPQHSQSTEARQRFLREARSAARLRHPNVASVFHFGTIHRPSGDHEAGSAPSESEGTEEYFYAMEFVEGETLEERLRRTGPLSSQLTLEIALQISRALAAAEKRGLVHRDLKPANIMLAADAEDLGADQRRSGLSNAWVKVIDFGLAKAVGGAAEHPGDMALEPVNHAGFSGTPQFASPEQFGHMETDVRSDFFSLGAVLWYLLTGNLLFKGRSLDEIRDQQLQRPLPLEQLAERHVPTLFIELLDSMLAADLEQRPASATELHERLEQCLFTQPLAPPASPLPAVNVPATRRLLSWAWIGVSVLLLLLVGAAAAYWLKRPFARPAPVEASVTPGPRIAANGAVLSSNLPIGRAQILYVTNFQSNTVGMYDGLTGEPINAALITGLSGPSGIVVSGSKLYVANETSGTVGLYNAQTGAPINRALITGLSQPVGLALAGSRLYLSDGGTLVVSVYDAVTGAAIKAPLVGGLTDPEEVIVAGNNLYVEDGMAGTVATYDATTGAAINPSLITGLNNPYNAALIRNRLYLVTHGNNHIGVYDATTGAAINAALVTTVSNPHGLAVYTNSLYAIDYASHTIGVYNATSGQPFTKSFITGLHKPDFVTVVPPLPTVTLRAVTPQIHAASGEVGEVTLNLSAPQNYDVIVNFKITGDAINGADYEMIGSNAKIEAGKISQSIKIVSNPPGAARSEKRTVKIDLVPGDGYTLRTADSAEVSIVDRTPP